MSSGGFLCTGHMPAEWEYASAIMIAWPHSDTDWAYMLDQAQECYRNMADVFSRYAHVIVVAPDSDYLCRSLAALPCHDRIHYAEIATNDTWIRDYGPLTVTDDSGNHHALDFGFNGWGLKFAANLDNQVTSRMYQTGLLTEVPENLISFILEGGSIESDGCGTILTTSRCLLSPNRNGSLNKKEIDGYLRRWLGANNVLWLDNGGVEGDDTDGHIDTIARMAPERTIVYTGCSDTADSHYATFKAMKEQLATFSAADGKPYRLVELPMPPAVYDSVNGRRLAATYANFLALPDVLFMPTYDAPDTDHLAADILGRVFAREVVGVDARALIRQNGSLHCATMQIPLDLLNI